MESSKYSRIHRLLKVLALVQSGRATSPAELAEACGVTERSIFRDITELEGAGFRIAYNKTEKRYSIDGDAFLPPVQLTSDEALAIAVLCEQVARHDRIPFTSPAWKGVSKIFAAMPESLRDEVAAIADGVFIRTAQAIEPDGFGSVYERIGQAIAARRSLDCKYDSLNPETTDCEEFAFDPYALLFSVRAWYAVGFHHGRGEIRTLKLNRFTGIGIADRRFEIPEDFHIDGHLGNAWRMMRGDVDHEVVIRFDPNFAETIADTTWHRTQEIEELEDGSAIFRCTVSGLDEIVWWVLSMGPHCEVISPPELRDRVVEAVGRMGGRYAGRPGAASP